MKMYPILTVLTCILALATSIQYPHCPNKAQLQPCTCDEEGFNCRQATDVQSIQEAFTSESGEAGHRALFIQGTPITRLSKGVFGRFQFVEFNIDVNRISKVEDGVFRGSADIVEVISLFGNKLVSFPFRDVQDLPHLTKLSLSKNQLSEIPYQAFGQQPQQSLTHLYLSDNNIHLVRYQAFEALPNLQELYLDNNKIEKLNNGQAFAKGNQLKKIFLNNNELQALDYEFWVNPGLLNIEEIHLENNKLTSLDDQPFKKSLPKNGKLFVGGNPFDCRSCERCKWIVENTPSGIEGMTCST